MQVVHTQVGQFTHRKAVAVLVHLGVAVSGVWVEALELPAALHRYRRASVWAQQVYDGVKSNHLP